VKWFLATFRFPFSFFPLLLLLPLPLSLSLSPLNISFLSIFQMIVIKYLSISSNVLLTDGFVFQLVVWCLVCGVKKVMVLSGVETMYTLQC